MQQVPDEEVQQAALAIAPSGAVAAPGNLKKVEVLARLNQAIDDLKRGRRVDVLIHLPHHEQQLALEPPGVVRRRLSA